MPKFVPTLFEGESLYSWLARWGLRSGMPSKRIALKYLIGENHLQLMSLLPSYAGILANLSLPLEREFQQLSKDVLYEFFPFIFSEL